MSAFREEVRDWLRTALDGRFAALRGINDFVSAIDARRAWEQALGEARLSCISWPSAYGGRDASFAEQISFAEEYARAQAPSRLGHVGVELAGPTIMAFGTEAQKQRFLPDIAAGNVIWAQGYSEPNAGSDLANVRTRAHHDGSRWIVDGQKIWTSLGPIADWIFVLARSDKDSQGPKGLSYLLMPLDQQGVTIKPIRQITGEAEFAEVFFDAAIAASDDIIGAPGEGWAVAMATLGFERGISTLTQQMQFANELEALIDVARSNGKGRDPIIRQRLAKAWVGLQIMRHGLLSSFSAEAPEQLDGDALTSKLNWSRWHRDLGDLAMDIQGTAGEICLENSYDFGKLTKLYLASRSDTIYAGSSQIQRNIISERGLGLPREPRGPIKR